MKITDIKKGDSLELSNGRNGRVVEVFSRSGRSESGKMRKPRVVVKLENKPSMLIKVSASQIVGLT